MRNILPNIAESTVFVLVSIQDLFQEENPINMLSISINSEVSLATAYLTKLDKLWISFQYVLLINS